MLKIPASFKNNGEDYVTIPTIKNFINKHNINIKGPKLREDCFNKIIEFGNQNDEQAEIVLQWIDGVVQEGIKDIQLIHAPLSEKIKLLASNETKFKKYLENHISTTTKKHICQNDYTSEFTLVNIFFADSKVGKKIVFIFCKKLYCHDSKLKLTKIIDYPVIAEYYLQKEWLLVKAKPKSGLYVYTRESFNIEVNDSTTTDKEITFISKKVADILCVEEVDAKQENKKLKRKIFMLLDKYTSTPQEIDVDMEEGKDVINEISERILGFCKDDKCIVPLETIKDVQDDIKNIVEKYLSINWKDKSIFTKDREAFPVKLSATDEEESKVEQTAGAQEPLQTKALFFDNKKMLYKSKSCDGIVFRWRRIEPLVGQSELFTVKISTTKGKCTFKFTEYTNKEDIENVIFSIIGVE